LPDPGPRLAYRRVFLGEGRRPPPDGQEVLDDLARHCKAGDNSLIYCKDDRGRVDPLRVAAYEGARGVLALIRYMLEVEPEDLTPEPPPPPRKELD
jgi:hypothetical protein